MGITFVMATVIAATAASGCTWAHPGANPYRGDPVDALSDFAMPDETRRQLRVLMAAHRYTDIATITRNEIVGRQRYEGLREMHSGHGQTCHGSVDRSAWSDRLQERGLVYCAADTCVIVPTICNNVSLVTRRPDERTEATEEEGPIDISPAAGPPSAAAAPSTSMDSGQSTLDFLTAPGQSESTSGGLVNGGDEAGRDTGCAVGCFSGGSGGGSGSIGSGAPGRPVSPTVPAGTLPPALPAVSAVPEAPASILMLVGLVLLITCHRAAVKRWLAGRRQDGRRQ